MAQGGQLTGTQTATKDYLVFAEFETMDTHVARVAMAPNRLAWCENLQIIGPNQLTTVPAPAPALTMIAGKVAQKLFYGFMLNVDYEFFCATDGSMIAVNLSGGAQTVIAPPGTFSSPDVTIWSASVALIADPSAGYCAWNGSALSKAGGVSPNITVTAGGSGYNLGATAAITGGSGSGATATVQVVGGVVVGLTLTNPGTGYQPTDVLTVTITPIGGGAGATASANVWPTLNPKPSTLAVYAARVWLGATRVLTWTGIKGYDDFAAANASGSTTITDNDLVHQITALRSLNNFLWIFGDNSIKQIGTITVTSGITNFSIVTLSSDTGTTFPLSIVSYNRLVLFANKVGVFAVLGSSVQKVSDEMDGIFQRIDFTQALCAALNDINAIRCYLLLVRYVDPVAGRTRSLLLTFQSKKWFVCSQGDSLTAMSTAVLAGTLETFASSGADVTQILQATTTAVSILLQTALAHHDKPFMGKRALRAATAQSSTSTGTMNLTIDTENGSVPEPYSVAFPVIWRNALNQVVTWINALAQVVTFTGSGFLYQRTPAAGTGIYLGVTLSGSFFGYSFNNAVIEYQEATALASKTSV